MKHRSTAALLGGLTTCAAFSLAGWGLAGPGLDGPGLIGSALAATAPTPAAPAAPAGVGEGAKAEAADKAREAGHDKGRHASPGAGDRSGAQGKAGTAGKPGGAHDNAPSDSMSTTSPDNKAGGAGKRSDTIDSEDVRRDAGQRQNPPK